MLPTAFVLLPLASYLLTSDPRPATDLAEPQRLVADLGHPEYTVREKAQRHLWELGPAVVPILEQALTEGDPEVVRRARELLAKFAAGLRPDTPPEVVDLLRQFYAVPRHAPDTAERLNHAVLGLLRHGPHGRAVVRALLAKNLDPDTRAAVVRQVTAYVRQEVPRLLVAGESDRAAELIDLHAAGTGPEGAADYTAFFALRGELPAALARVAAGARNGPRSAETKLLLAYLHRAAGNRPQARIAAADLPALPNGPSLAELLDEEDESWVALADRGPKRPVNHPDALGLLLLSLAGRQAAVEAEQARLTQALTEAASPQDARQAAIALFAVNQARQAVGALARRRDNRGLLAEALILQMRFREVLELTTPPDEPISTDGSSTSPVWEHLELEIRRGRVLTMLGRRDEAVRVFGRVTDSLVRLCRPDAGYGPYQIARQLLRAEIRSGLTELADEHAARLLTAGAFTAYGQPIAGESAFEILFETDAVAAETLYRVLRARRLPGDDPAATLTRVRDLLAGRAAAAAVDQSLAALREAVADGGDRPVGAGDRSLPALDPPADAERCLRLFAWAVVCRAAHRGQEALAAFESAAALAPPASDPGTRSWTFGTSTAYRIFVEWGDALSAARRHREAAEAYLTGWRRYPDQPLLLFLSGQALERAGEMAEGRHRQELAHWIPLGQERVRGQFLDELIRRGEGRAMRRERDLLLKVCWCHDAFAGNVLNQATRASMLLHDPATAEACSRRSFLVVLKTPGLYYLDPGAYILVPANLLAYRARARLAEGKADEAVALARELLAVLPGHVELISDLVPRLAAAGRRAEADELFASVWSAYQQVLREHPESAWACHALASLAANCRRELAAALDYAQRAVRLHPGFAPYRETLAEVYFRRGDRDQARAVMSRLSEEFPRNRLYQRQLVRYQFASLDSPRPDTED